MAHLPTTFIREFSLWSSFKEKERKSWHPKLPGDFSGRMSFPQILMKAKITNNSLQILFQIVSLSCICKQPLIFRCSRPKSFLNLSLFCCDTYFDFISDQKDRKLLNKILLKVMRLNPLIYRWPNGSPRVAWEGVWAHWSGALLHLTTENHGWRVCQETIALRRSQHAEAWNDNHLLFLMCLLVSWRLAHLVWVYLEWLSFHVSHPCWTTWLGPGEIFSWLWQKHKGQAATYKAFSAKRWHVTLLVLYHSIGQSEPNGWTHNQGLGKSSPLLEWKETQSHGQECGYSEGWRAGANTVNGHREEVLWLLLVSETILLACNCDMLVCSVAVMMTIITWCF